MTDKDDLVDGEEEEKVIDKHQWGAKDLQKVAAVNEEGDEIKISSDALGKLLTGNDQKQQPARKVVNIKKEDLQMIMNELELPKAIVEKKLIETDGDPKAALRSLLGLN